MAEAKSFQLLTQSDPPHSNYGCPLTLYIEGASVSNAQDTRVINHKIIKFKTCHLKLYAHRSRKTAHQARHAWVRICLLDACEIAAAESGKICYNFHKGSIWNLAGRSEQQIWMVRISHETTCPCHWKSVDSLVRILHSSERRRLDLERKLAAILAADVVGFSRLMHEDEEGTLASFQQYYRELIEPKVADHQGRVVKTTGDGLLLEFASVVDAVRCAIEVQDEMARLNDSVRGDRKMLLRMGINLGDIILVGDDIYGDGVNIAARLETMASPGGICISGTVYDQLAGKINQVIKDMGEQSLRNIEDPIRTYKILPTGTEPELLENPPSATLVPDLGFGAPERPKIAILPFKNLSRDPDQNFLAEGLRLGIVSSLVQLSGIFLISTDAVNVYKDKEGAAVQAGREVAAGYILEGSVQQVGQTLRVTLHLTNVGANEIIWSERYDAKVDDLFKVQDEITQEVLISLNVKLVAGERGRVWFDDITDPQAREFYHRGISHVYSGTKDDNEAALRQMLEFYRVQPDTDHGPSFIALIHLTNAIFGWSESESRSLDEASRWAEIAVKYEKNSGIGYIVNGHLKLLQGQHNKALESCERAIGIRPSCSFTHGILAGVQNFCGDSQLAVQHAREALLIERVYPPWIVNVLATAYRGSGKVELSIPAAREALRLEPLQNEARLILCSDYMLADLKNDARQIAREVLAVEPTFNVLKYAEKQPYKHREKLEQIVEALRAAGLPE